MARSVMVLPWVTRGHYGRLREIATDAEILPQRYDQWLKRAEEFENNVHGGGIWTLRVYFDPEDFFRWAMARGVRLDIHARKRFCEEIAAQRNAAEEGEATEGT
ncbi:MAG: hypothetical protein HIU82_02265 [Proteobacteria bacterium]|nr:hypothetical protein [Pseudomonadota bacterium]